MISARTAGYALLWQHCEGIQSVGAKVKGVVNRLTPPRQGWCCQNVVRANFRQKRHPKSGLRYRSALKTGDRTLYRLRPGCFEVNIRERRRADDRANLIICAMLRSVPPQKTSRSLQCATSPGAVG